MTTGSTIINSRVGFQTGYVDAFGNYHATAIVPVGSYYSKTWSGTDRPHVKRTYEVFKLYRRDTGRTYSYKRRSDVPTRLKEEDHPYSCSIHHERTTGYRVSNSNSIQYADEASGLPLSGVDPSSEWNSNDTLAVIGKLRSQIAGSDFNAGVFLGEGHQALSMILNAATRIRKALYYVKRLNVILAAEALGVVWGNRRVHRTVSANWLELQYGWLPLLGDAKNAAEFLAKVLEFPMVQAYRARKTKPQVLGITPTWPDMDRVILGYTKYQILARLTEVSTPALAGLTDPWSVAWELLPFSFVADWFIPIGGYLQARGLASALTGTFVTTKTVYTNVSYALKDYATGGGIQHFSTPNDRWERNIVVTRTVSTSLDVPLPSWKPLSQVASWKHCANAVALLVQKVF